MTAKIKYLYLLHFFHSIKLPFPKFFKKYFLKFWYPKCIQWLNFQNTGDLLLKFYNHHTSMQLQLILRNFYYFNACINIRKTHEKTLWYYWNDCISKCMSSTANTMLFSHIYLRLITLYFLVWYELINLQRVYSAAVDKLTSRSSCTSAVSLSFSAWALDATERLSVTSACSSNRRPM